MMISSYFAHANMHWYCLHLVVLGKGDCVRTHMCLILDLQMSVECYLCLYALPCAQL